MLEVLRRGARAWCITTLLIACGGDDTATAEAPDADAGVDGTGGNGGTPSGGSGSADSGNGTGGDSAGGGAGARPGSGGAPDDAGGGGAPGDPCRNSLDCVDAPGNRTICDPETESCVECVGASDCADGNTCAANTCVESNRCVNSLDCVAASGERPICDRLAGECVECATAADCGDSADCVRNACVPFTACVNSLDCEAGNVCDRTLGRCVECANDPDCTDGARCVAHTCRAPCDSDNDCTGAGLLCDFDLGVCAACLGDDDCADAEFCSGGACEADVCVQGTARCNGNTVVACSERGDAWVATDCGSRQTCVERAAAAICEDWICTAGATECTSPTTVTECSSNGLSVVTETDCALTDEYCAGGNCSDRACEPDALFCQQGDLRVCASDGFSSSVRQACSNDEYCDTASLACRPTVCAPNQPACDADRATTCNATGSGFLPGGTDCSASSQTCVLGECSNCPSGGALDSVRFAEVHLGAHDYVILANRSSTCPADLGGLTVEFMNESTSANLALEPFSLGAGETAFVAEPDAPDGADTLLSGNININQIGYLLLCKGPCSTVAPATVLDAIRFTDGTAPPALPAPMTMDPVTGITSSNLQTHSYVRAAYGGSYPAFLASDWSTATATRESDQCPATQPPPFPTGVCITLGLTCTYGAVTCQCQAALWVCS